MTPSAMTQKKNEKDADVQALASFSSIGDYLALLKPRVMSLVIFTALAGFVVAPTHGNPVLSLIGLFCVAIGAGASGALNMWYDADIDALMRRTATRPIPSGRVHPAEALAFGLTLSGGSVMVLGLAVSWLAAAMLAFTIFFYAVIYTMWLKRWTAQNIVIGGAAGAFPPMIGWTIATGQLSWESAALFLIIFLWTPPHFWALALLKSEEYAKAGVPMLPSVAGREATRKQIFLYTLLLVPSTFLPPILGFASWIYTSLAVVMGAMFLLQTYAIMQATDETEAPIARKTFGFSILYLFLLFASLLAEDILGLAPITFGGLTS
jgi:heme o synthase